MKPREALLMIPGFAHARVDGPLAEGVTSASWLVEHHGEAYVLRIDKPEAAELGLDRLAEGEILAVVAAAGLSPETVFHEAGRGVSLRRHVAGRPWTADDLGSFDNLDRLATVLRDLHALPPAGALYEPGWAARRYAQQLGTPAARQLADEANVLLAELRYPPGRECLCHNDLVADNLIDAGDRLVPIDWEYAGIGDPLFDLAVVMEHHELAGDVRAHLLSRYLRRAATPPEDLRVQNWCRFYRLLLRLWLLRVPGA